MRSRDVGEIANFAEQQLPLVERIFQMENLPAFLAIISIGVLGWLIWRNFIREDRGE